jgi:ribosome-dependent ATPase
LPSDKIEDRVQELLKRYDLSSVANAKPESLPLGIKQRLQLAVAVLHEPAILILDEPTSGVDPIARDAFWRTLIDLSRDDGVTIFLSTHFMNEASGATASRLHAGKAAWRAADLVRARQRFVGDTFVDYLADAASIDRSKKSSAAHCSANQAEIAPAPKMFDLAAVAYARETVELCAIRSGSFAFFGPIILMAAFATAFPSTWKTCRWQRLTKTAFSRGCSTAAGSRYFQQRPSAPSRVIGYGATLKLSLKLQWSGRFASGMYQSDATSMAR